MTFNQLKYFLAVCECGSLSAAAESLHISEPSISVAIKQLEEEFAFSLFHRVKKRLVLTEEGKLFQSKATEIINNISQLENQMKNLRKNTPSTSLATPVMAGVFLCSKLISAFSEQNPSTRFEMRELSSIEAAQQVAEGKLDIAIVNRNAVLCDRLDFSPIMETKVLGYVGKDHPLAHKEAVTPPMLKNEKLVLTGGKSITTQTLLRHFKETGVEPNIFMYSSRTLFTIQVVKQYNAVAFFMEDLLTSNNDWAHGSFNDLASFSICPPIRFTLGSIRRKNAPLPNDALKFLDFCKHYKGS